MSTSYKNNKRKVDSTPIKQGEHQSKRLSANEEVLNKRRGIIFYSDHNPENFVDMISKLGVTREKLKEWAKKYSEAGINLTASEERYKKVIEEEISPEDSDLIDYAKDDLEDCQNEFDEAVNTMFYGWKSGLSFSNTASVKGRYDNEFGIVLSKYGTFFVKINGVLESGGELVLAFANSKCYELPVSLDLITSEWKNPRESLFCSNPEYPNEFPETWDPLKGTEGDRQTAINAYESLHCLDGNFGVAYAYMGDSKRPETLQEENVFSGHKYLDFDCYEGFVKILGQDNEKTRELWNTWRPEREK
jgi:hypothetical protein